MTKVRAKAPTKSEQIEELKINIKNLEAEKQDLYDRALRAEADVRQSDPYLTLQRQLEEREEWIADLRNHVSQLQVDLGLEKDKCLKLQEELQRKSVQVPVQSPAHVRPGRPVKITEEKREEVRSLRAEGKSIRKIADLCQLSVGSVSAILRGV